MKTISTLLTVLAIASLAACSSAPRKPDYECPIDDVAAAKCSSVAEAYAKSKSMVMGDKHRVQSVFDSRVQGQSAAAATAAQPVFTGQTSDYPEPGQNGAPVFQQPSVMRVWTAPYVDADGNLRSGEYTYFSTPGKWNYGGLKTAGSAGGSMFGPARADQLGFNPVVEPEKKAIAAPAKPGDAPGSTSGAQVSPNTITQPFQRLSN